MSTILDNIDAMRRAAADGAGMDVIIICTGTRALADYWQQRLEATRGQITGAGALVLAVDEDWPGGAGNGLGTLYALTRARQKGLERFGSDLLDRLDQGASVALYHTAGKGQRLAPLPGSESNNKPGVKLPGLVHTGGGPVPISILEAVIMQTSIYASSRAGRVSVFWGDQVFVPDRSPAYQPSGHADILARLDSVPSADEWQAQGLDRYGLLAIGRDGHAAQVEKITRGRLLAMVDEGVLSVDGDIGVSLGSFSMSRTLTRALLEEFSSELRARRGRLDSDPHFWMPLTLDPDTYGEIMEGKGETRETSGAHFTRMRALGERVLAGAEHPHLLAGVDVGKGGYWWDYGQLHHYLHNNHRATARDDEGAALRRFLGIADRREGSELGESVDVDADSCVLDCRIGGGHIRNCVLIGVDARHVELEDCVMIHCAVPEIRARNALLYDAVDAEPLELDAGAVRSDVWFPDGRRVALHTRIDRDGRADWERSHSGNPLSYAELYDANQGVDPGQVVDLKSAARQRLRDGLWPQSSGSC